MLVGDFFLDAQHALATRRVSEDDCLHGHVLAQKVAYRLLKHVVVHSQHSWSAHPRDPPDLLHSAINPSVRNCLCILHRKQNIQQWPQVTIHPLVRGNRVCKLSHNECTLFRAHSALGGIHCRGSQLVHLIVRGGGAVGLQARSRSGHRPLDYLEQDMDSDSGMVELLLTNS